MKSKPILIQEKRFDNMSVKYTCIDTPIDMDKLFAVRKLVENWLKPVPAEKFYWYSEHPLESDDYFKKWIPYKGEYKYFQDNLFTNRYIKSVFMGHLRCAESFHEIAGLLKSLDEVWGAGEFVEGCSVLEVFLCTERALKNWRYTKELVKYADNSDGAKELLEDAYNLEEKLDNGGLKKLYIVVGNDACLIEKEKVSIEDRFSKLEYNILSLPVYRLEDVD